MKWIIAILTIFCCLTAHSQQITSNVIVEYDDMDFSGPSSFRSPWRYSRSDSTLYRWDYNTLVWEEFSAGSNFDSKGEILRVPTLADTSTITDLYDGLIIVVQSTDELWQYTGAFWKTILPDTPGEPRLFFDLTTSNTISCDNSTYAIFSGIIVDSQISPANSGNISGSAAEGINPAVNLNVYFTDVRDGWLYFEASSFDLIAGNYLVTFTYTNGGSSVTLEKFTVFKRIPCRTSVATLNDTTDVKNPQNGDKIWVESKSQYYFYNGQWLVEMGSTDGVATAGVLDAANTEFDFTVASPGSNFSVDFTGIGGTVEFTGWDKSAADDFDGAWGSLTGVPAGFADDIDNVDDADASTTNEIQALSWAAGTGGDDEISLSLGGGTVTITDDTGTDDQTAAEVSYDSTVSGLAATEVQTAIDLLEDEIDVVSSSTSDGVATAGVLDAANTEFDFTVASPGSNFSVDYTGIAASAEFSSFDKDVTNELDTLGFLADAGSPQKVSDGGFLDISGNWGVATVASTGNIDIRLDTNLVSTRAYADNVNTDSQGFTFGGSQAFVLGIDNNATQAIFTVSGNATSSHNGSGTFNIDVGGDGTGTDDQTASEVPITDTGAYYTGTHVEDALQEVGAAVFAKSRANFLAFSTSTVLDQGATFQHITSWFGNSLVDFTTTDSTLTYNGVSGKSFILHWGANLEIATTANTTFSVDISPYINSSESVAGKARVQVDLNTETYMIPVSGFVFYPSLSNGSVISLRNTATVNANTTYTLRNYNLTILEQ